jgi:molybdopterin-guanine dinucleotide biosynthesis protein A
MLEFPDWRCNCLDRSAVILAGGSSTGFNGDKGISELNGKPLISHVVNTLEGLVDEVVVVTDSQERADIYTKLLSSKVKFAIDSSEIKGSLVGATAGFEAASGEYSALLPFDSPFVSQEVISLLFDCAVGKAAIIPRSTDMECEPLHAVYHTKQALVAAKEALEENDSDLQAMVERLRGVRYMSMMVIEQLDPDLKTFFRVNTTFDLKKAAVMGKPRKTSKTKQINVRRR